MRGLTYGIDKKIGFDIDKTGASEGVKQLQKAGVGVATGEISNEVIKSKENK